MKTSVVSIVAEAGERAPLYLNVYFFYSTYLIKAYSERGLYVMLDEYYVILATDKDDNTIYYASNTGPLLWTTEFSMIKPFNSLDSAKADLDDEEFIVKDILKYSPVNAIYISRFKGIKEVERIEYNVN